MNHPDNSFIQFLEDNIAECARQSAALTGDDRRDEANFMNIRKNIYEVFLTVYNTAIRTCKDDAAAEVFFADKLSNIPSNWAASLEKAEAHGDTAKAYIERIKLEAAKVISERFNTIRRF